MKLSTLVSGGEVFASCECMLGYAFDMGSLGVNCALLSVICAGFGLLRDRCAHFYRSVRLSPHTCVV